MKKLITAAFLTTAATTAYANDITFSAGAEYSVEAETFEMNAGAAYNLYDFALFTEATVEAVMCLCKPRDKRTSPLSTYKIQIACCQKLQSRQQTHSRA